MEYLSHFVQNGIFQIQLVLGTIVMLKPNFIAGECIFRFFSGKFAKNIVFFCTRPPRKITIFWYQGAFWKVFGSPNWRFLNCSQRGDSLGPQGSKFVGQIARSSNFWNRAMSTRLTEVSFSFFYMDGHFICLMLQGNLQNRWKCMKSTFVSVALHLFNLFIWL